MSATVIRLSIETVLAIHTELMVQTGGRDGVREADLLDLALNSPYQNFGGADLYPAVIDKISHIAFSLIKNHPFIDGNKRIGVTVMLVLLKANGIALECTNGDLADLGFGVADGSYDGDYIRRWIAARV
jgi:death-on-curing protein